MKRVFLFLLAESLCFSTPIDLKIGARPQGMGGAFVSVVNDSNALYWNPAGLAQIPCAEVSFVHTNPFGAKSTYIDWVSIVQPFRKSSGLGLGFIYKSSILEEGIDKRKTRMADSEFIASFASSIEDSIMYGGNVKMLSLSSKVDKGKGMGFDIGLLYKGDFPIKDFSIGFMYRNLASQIKDESFPKEIRAGISKTLFNERLLLSSDCSIKRDVNKRENDIKWYIGFEGVVFKNLLLRGGCDDGDITLGTGLIYSRYQFDYSFLSEREYELPNTHRFGISIRF